MLRVLIGILSLSFVLASCGESRKEVSWTPPQSSPSPLERKISGNGPQETPISPPIDPQRLDLCTRHLLFADQYITASDYPGAEEEVEAAKKYCKPSDPRLLYMEALIADINEKKDKAYKLYYRAAKGYIKQGDMDSAFKCYSAMVSIKPNGKEVRELRRYFEDDNY